MIISAVVKKKKKKQDVRTESADGLGGDRVLEF